MERGRWVRVPLSSRGERKKELLLIVCTFPAAPRDRALAIADFDNPLLSRMIYERYFL